MAETTGTCSEFLKVLDIFGLTETIGAPGSYTCYRRLDPFSLEIGILPGRFSAKEIAELYKAAALNPPAAQPFPRAA